MEPEPPSQPAPTSDDAAQLLRRESLATAIDSNLADAAWREIERARRVLIVAHEHPDPDTLGSALAMAHLLETATRTCIVACADPVPATYSFLPGYDRVVSTLPHQDFDLVLALDAGELSRYGKLYSDYRAVFEGIPIVNFDHHITSAGCGVVNIIDPSSAATAELLTLFLLNRGMTITRQAAQCLLAGIITDTRSFEYDATTARTLTAGAYLVGCGALPETIIKPMYRMKELARVRLWGEVLHTVSSTAGGKIIWALVLREHLAKTGATADMDDGLSSYLIDTDGAGIALLFKEQDDGTTRVSLRTAAPYDAARMAAHFGGGGHVRAAGFGLRLDTHAAVEEVVTYAEMLI